MDHEKALWTGSKVFAPTFPRRCTGANQMQGARKTRGAFVDALMGAISAEKPGYYSVYSFPRGHPQNGNIPRVDCIFIDLDVRNIHYQPNPDKSDYDVSLRSWRADMSALLARAQMIAQAIIDAGRAENFRVTLSGHKGIHLYLDFPPINTTNGNIEQFKSGLSDYGETVMEWLDELAGGVNIDPWVDVDGSDLARLSRHPNTIHHGAKYDDQTRWCVPITVEELADLNTEAYLDYTSEPRWPEIERCPSQEAHDRAEEMIRAATSSRSSTSGGAAKTAGVEEALAEYCGSERVNDDLKLDDVLFFVKDKPCFKSFRNRDDAYSYGQQSRVMELSIMGRLLEMGAPRDVIHEFFEPIPGYDETTTDNMIGDLLARDNEYGEFNCNTICNKAARFCCGDSCSIYRRSDDLQK